jgi:hypothetical protein
LAEDVLVVLSAEDVLVDEEVLATALLAFESSLFEMAPLLSVSRFLSIF